MRRDGSDTDVTGLGQALERGAVVRLVDAHPPGGKVDVVPRERALLAGARAYIGSERDEGPIELRQLAEEPLDLLGSEDEALVGGE